jgi:hypothetical protein
MFGCPPHFLPQVKWCLVIVYGVLDENEEEFLEFLIELAIVCQDQNLPFLAGGDFNSVRFAFEKNTTFINNRWIDMLNSLINSRGLGELYMTSWKYTLANNLVFKPRKNLHGFGQHILGEPFPMESIYSFTRDV